MENLTRDYYQELAELRAWAERVRAGLTRLERPGSPVAVRELARAGRLADELAERAAEPVTIGMVGEFAVGKSRLLNSLLKQPGLLPVSGSATTGNITALRLRAVGPGEVPGLRHAWVSYMSRRELSRLAGFILGKLTSWVNQYRLRYDVSGLRDYDPVASGWDNFERLARGWWEQGAESDQRHRVDQGIRLYAWELLRLRDAMELCDELLPERADGRPVEIDTALVRAAIEIGQSRALPDRFPERPTRRPVRADAPITAELLRDSFPLIRRITYDVAIESGLLTLDGLRDSNGLELLDFAGLEALGGARDEYLCGRELERITAYVEVGKADHIEANVMVRFGAMLEGRRRSKAHLSDSVLLVANKFDLVEVPEPRATVTELASESEHLDALLRVARPMSPRLARLALTTALPERADRGWAAVADVLGGWDGDPAADQLAAALRAYAADGGMTRLREMLSDHIATKALPVMVDELDALRRELCATLGRLRGLTAPPEQPADGTGDQTVLSELVVGLFQMAADAKGGATAFRDADAIAVAASDDDAAAGTAVRQRLLERITEEAVIRVYAWPEWNAIFSRYREESKEIREADPGAVPPPAPTADDKPGRGWQRWAGWAGGVEADGRAADDIDAGDGDSGGDEYKLLLKRRSQQRPGSGETALATRMPLTTSDFQVSFENSLSELRDVARTLARHVIEEWIAGVYQRHAAFRARMADQSGRSLLAGRLEAIDPDGGAPWFGLLELITDLGWIPGLFGDFLSAIEKSAARDGADPFPLASDHALPWHPLVEKAVTEDNDLKLRRHHSKAHRLRHDLAEGLAFPVQTAVAMAFGSLEAELESRLAELQGQVPSQATLRAASPAASPADGGAGQAKDVGVLDELIGSGCAADSATQADEGGNQ